MCLRMGDYKMPSVHLCFSLEILLGTFLSWWVTVMNCVPLRTPNCQNILQSLSWFQKWLMVIHNSQCWLSYCFGQSLYTQNNKIKFSRIYLHSSQLYLLLVPSSTSTVPNSTPAVQFPQINHTHSPLTPQWFRG